MLKRSSGYNEEPTSQKPRPRCGNNLATHTVDRSRCGGWGRIDRRLHDSLGPGDRACSISMPFLRTVAADALCRGAFGIGAILVAVFLGLVVRSAITSHSET